MSRGRRSWELGIRALPGKRRVSDRGRVTAARLGAVWHTGGAAPPTRRGWTDFSRRRTDYSLGTRECSLDHRRLVHLGPVTCHKEGGEKASDDGRLRQVGGSAQRIAAWPEPANEPGNGGHPNEPQVAPHRGRLRTCAAVPKHRRLARRRPTADLPLSAGLSARSGQVTAAFAALVMSAVLLG